MHLRPVLRSELARRRRVNARYSLRAFAQSLQVHHSALSRLLASRAGVAPRTVRRLARRLGLSREAIALMCRDEAESRVAEAVLRCGARRPHSRLIASLTGVPLDGVNVALQSLLARGALQMREATHWQLVGSGSSASPRVVKTLQVEKDASPWK